MCPIINNFKNFSVIKEAENGQQLIDLIKAGVEVQLVLLDLDMPLLNGYEAAKWLKTNRSDIKILVLTAFENDRVTAEAINCGADAVISKNIDLKNLYQILKDLVTGNFNDHLDYPDPLTARELLLLKLMCTDLKYESIAIKMGLSLRLVEDIRNKIFKKFKINNRSSMVFHAIKTGIVTGDLEAV
jgi:DNA-binding NarL/FixJ family response regulator